MQQWMASMKQNAEKDLKENQDKYVPTNRGTSHGRFYRGGGPPRAGFRNKGGII